MTNPNSEKRVRGAIERAVKTAFAAYMQSHEPPIKGIVADLTGIAADTAGRAASVALSDEINGTPCAEIRWQQERETLTARIAELEKAVDYFMSDERFQVGVAGNPNAVEAMLAEVRAIRARPSPAPIGTGHG